MTTIEIVKREYIKEEGTYTVTYEMAPAQPAIDFCGLTTYHHQIFYTVLYQFLGCYMEFTGVPVFKIPAPYLMFSVVEDAREFIPYFEYDSSDETPFMSVTPRWREGWVNKLQKPVKSWRFFRRLERRFTRSLYYLEYANDIFYFGEEKSKDKALEIKKKNVLSPPRMFAFHLSHEEEFKEYDPSCDRIFMHTSAMARFTEPIGESFSPNSTYSFTYYLKHKDLEPHWLELFAVNDLSQVKNWKVSEANVQNYKGYKALYEGKQILFVGSMKRPNNQGIKETSFMEAPEKVNHYFIQAPGPTASQFVQGILNTTQMNASSFKPFFKKFYPNYDPMNRYDENGKSKYWVVFLKTNILDYMKCTRIDFQITMDNENKSPQFLESSLSRTGRDSLPSSPRTRLGFYGSPLELFRAHWILVNFVFFVFCCCLVLVFSI